MGQRTSAAPNPPRPADPPSTLFSFFSPPRRVLSILTNCLFSPSLSSFNVPSAGFFKFLPSPFFFPHHAQHFSSNLSFVAVYTSRRFYSGAQNRCLYGNTKNAICAGGRRPKGESAASPRQPVRRNRNSSEVIHYLVFVAAAAFLGVLIRSVITGIPPSPPPTPPIAPPSPPRRCRKRASLGRRAETQQPNRVVRQQPSEPRLLM